MVVGSCRVRFTAEDFGFIRRALVHSSKDEPSLMELLTDEAERDLILDHDALYHALVDGVECLRITPSLYFYIVTRRALLQAGIDERALTDYVAAVLAAFAETRQLGEATSPRSNFLYVTDLLEALSEASPAQAFELRLRLGNYTLFFGGLFAQRVKAHSERRGSPGLSFYDGVGQASYATAAGDPRAQEGNLRRILEQLGSEFRAIRAALNELAENLLHFETPPHEFIAPRPTAS